MSSRPPLLVVAVLLVVGAAAGCGSAPDAARTSAASSTPPASAPPSGAAPTPTPTGPLLTAAPRPAHPSSGLIAYLDTTRPNADVVRYDLFVKRPDGTGVRQLTHGMDLVDFTWSPAGEWIAFSTVARDEATAWIYAIRPTGTAQVLLQDGACCSVSWSPDGTQLVYAGNDAITVLDLRTREIRQLPALPGLLADGAQWSPDGMQVAYVGYPKRRHRPPMLYVTDAATGQQTHAVPGTEGIGSFDWSPATGKIVYATAGHDRGDECVGDLFVTDAAGSDRRSLITWPCAETSPTWSLDGRTVTFHSYGPHPETSYGDGEFWWAVHSDGTGLRHLPGNDSGLEQPRP